MSEAYHSIRAVAQRTGLSAHVIRVWEKRYGVVQPNRTSTNRRLYSEEEVERLGLLKRATQGGHSIKDVAGLSMGRLRELAENIANEPDKAVETSQSAGALEECLSAIKAIDAQAFESVLNRSHVELGAQGLAIRVIAPLVVKIGSLWKEGTITAAHEHFASAFIRVFLANSARPYAASAEAPVIVVVTPVGQLHELGALLAALVAGNGGWNVKYLGASLPAADIAGAVRQTGARAIALSLVYPGDDPYLAGELAQLRGHVGNGVAILVGGRAAPSYWESLERVGATYCANVEEYESALDQLRSGKFEDTTRPKI